MFRKESNKKHTWLRWEYTCRLLYFLWFYFPFPLWNSGGTWRGGDLSHQANCSLSLLSFVRDFVSSSSRLCVQWNKVCQLELGLGIVTTPGYSFSSLELELHLGLSWSQWYGQQLIGEGRGDTDQMFCKLSPPHHRCHSNALRFKSGMEVEKDKIEMLPHVIKLCYLTFILNFFP